MADLESVGLSCSAIEEFSSAFAAVCRSLPPEVARRLKDVLKNHFAAHGIHGAYERMNNRTVAQIFAEYRPLNVKPLAAGEMEGVRYELYDAPSRSSNDDEQKPKA
jgi:hypothetical protein